jgi:hypothetical protein
LFVAGWVVGTAKMHHFGAKITRAAGRSAVCPATYHIGENCNAILTLEQTQYQLCVAKHFVIRRQWMTFHKPAFNIAELPIP